MYATPFLVFAISLATSSALIARDSLAEIPPKETVKIAGTSYSGSGCPKGSVSTILSDDRTVVTFGFDKFQALIGPRAKPADASKNCEIKMQLRYPNEYQLSIVRATYHGYIRLDDGVTAQFLSSYFWDRPHKTGAAPKSVKVSFYQCLWPLKYHVEMFTKTFHT